MTTYLVTGANGQLGHLAVEALLKTVPAANVAALVRSAEKGAELKALGVDVRIGDYDKPETLEAAFKGIDRLLLVSSSQVGKRKVQHGNAIAAAKRAGVGLVAYTSLLHADAKLLKILSDEHNATEAALAGSGIPYVLLRNGWYTENLVQSLPHAIESGVYASAAGDGRFATATRADYAAAAAAVLTGAEIKPGTIYELAGDEAFTLTDFVAEAARQAEKPITYTSLPEADYRAALVAAGLPAPVADMLADSDTGAANGGLFDDSHTLSKLIGRPTTPYAETIAAALKA
ncbi:NAD(P)H dehydrogenase (quinone) [Breoghania corrubedonensis]|uniref:NAD(P)H dehydrogenase (Quinone) n=1 Tax=Breoghania corrubedonensis TaxID=665038 RepID=A0A2T5VAS7_9HYPH|nr:SDR family oxidoreductase [Breoghania corrubedonensis]PTW60848.1 NAD(P)H dehydrogenase (quinone) [Breoghania corrubedonensis]